MYTDSGLNGRKTAAAKLKSQFKRDAIISGAIVAAATAITAIVAGPQAAVKLAAISIIGGAVVTGVTALGTAYDQVVIRKVPAHIAASRMASNAVEGFTVAASVVAFFGSVHFCFANKPKNDAPQKDAAAVVVVGPKQQLAAASRFVLAGSPRS